MKRTTLLIILAVITVLMAVGAFFSAQPASAGPEVCQKGLFVVLQSDSVVRRYNDANRTQPFPRGQELAQQGVPYQVERCESTSVLLDTDLSDNRGLLFWVGYDYAHVTQLPAPTANRTAVPTQAVPVRTRTAPSMPSTNKFAYSCPADGALATLRNAQEVAYADFPLIDAFVADYGTDQRFVVLACSGDMSAVYLVQVINNQLVTFWVTPDEINIIDYAEFPITH